MSLQLAYSIYFLKPDINIKSHTIKYEYNIRNANDKDFSR